MKPLARGLLILWAALGPASDADQADAHAPFIHDYDAWLDNTELGQPRSNVSYDSVLLSYPPEG